MRVVVVVADGRAGSDQLPVDDRNHPAVPANHGVRKRTVKNGMSLDLLENPDLTKISYDVEPCRTVSISK